MKIIIVGGVAGGASAAARLRRLDEHAEIILLERGPFISFANCGLPYFIGGEIPKQDSLILQTPESFFKRFRVDVRVESEAVRILRDEKSLEIKNLQTGETYTETYDKLVLSPGAKPSETPFPISCTKGVFGLRDVPDAKAIRAYAQEKKDGRAVIVGGGYIGLEMAENLRAAGLDVSVVELSGHCIASLDADMACEVHNHLRQKGVHLFLETGVTEISQKENPAGESFLEVSVSRQGQSHCLKADLVILAVGVTPDTDFIREAGLEVTSKGAIVVDETLQTSDPNIYAAGDAIAVKQYVTGQAAYIPLAGPANKQGRIIADNICGGHSVYRGTQGSAILKVFDMTAAMTGVTEAGAKAFGLPCDKVFTYSPSHAGYYPGAKNMSIKTIYEPETGRILGAQIVGFDGVDKRCDVLAVAIRAGMTAADLIELELCYAPPYGSAKDPVNFAGYVIENQLTGKVKNFHWHDVDGLPRDGSVTLLDVRTGPERQTGYIDGFRHVPLDELRDRLDELGLDPKKPVYVHCHSGLRSYIACRILSQRGFDCYNLSGGYRFYDAVVHSKTAEDFPCYSKD